MNYLLGLLLILLTCSRLSAADILPVTAAAFDRYVSSTEQALQKSTPHDFLWLDHHPKEKSLVWLSQSVITPISTLEHGQQEAGVPGGLLQHWLGAVLFEGTTLERVRDYILDYADYKFYFKQFFVESRLVKREGDQFDAFLRLSRKQFSAVMLNINVTAKYTALDASHGYVISHSTHIGEVASPRHKDSLDQERPLSEAVGYLWRQNVYWRIEQTGDGVYVEMESITLSHPAGALSPGRLFNGFVQNMPREFVEGSIQALQQGFPRLHH